MAKAKAKKKKKPEYKLIEKRNKRWAVIGKDGKYINGEDKVEILIKEGKHREARKLLHKSIKNYPHDPEAKRLLEGLPGR